MQAGRACDDTYHCQEEAWALSTLLFMKCLMNRYKVSVCQQAGEGSYGVFPITVGEDCSQKWLRSPSISAAMDWERGPGAHRGFKGRRKSEMRKTQDRSSFSWNKRPDLRPPSKSWASLSSGLN